MKDLWKGVVVPHPTLRELREQEAKAKLRGLLVECLLEGFHSVGFVGVFVGMMVYNDKDGATVCASAFFLVLAAVSAWRSRRAYREFLLNRDHCGLGNQEK